MPNLPDVKNQSVPTERTIAITKIKNDELYVKELGSPMWQGNVRGSVRAVEFLLVEVKSSQLVSHNGHPG